MKRGQISMMGKVFITLLILGILGTIAYQYLYKATPNTLNNYQQCSGLMGAIAGQTGYCTNSPYCDASAQFDPKGLWYKAKIAAQGSVNGQVARPDIPAGKVLQGIGQLGCSDPNYPYCCLVLDQNQMAFTPEQITSSGGTVTTNAQDGTPKICRDDSTAGCGGKIGYVSTWANFKGVGCYYSPGDQNKATPVCFGRGQGVDESNKRKCSDIYVANKKDTMKKCRNDNDYSTEPSCDPNVLFSELKPEADARGRLSIDAEANTIVVGSEESSITYTYYSGSSKDCAGKTGISISIMSKFQGQRICIYKELPKDPTTKRELPPSCYSLVPS
jgi:hypothetical protein